MAHRLSARLQIAAIPIMLGLIAWMEAKQRLPLFRLYSFFLAFLLLADIAYLLRGKWRDALLVLTSIALGLFLVEAVANILEPKPSTVSTYGWVFRPVIGWGPQHEGRFHSVKTDPKTGAMIYSADYTIDSNLLRQTLSRETGPTIVFFGDSFTFGIGVNDADTLPQLFADALDRKQRVLNLGNGGYGPQQFLRELETGLFDSVIGPQPRLFVFLTMAGHAERTACKPFWVRRGPRYALENDKVVFKGACNEGMSLWLKEWLENMASYRVFIKPKGHKVSRDDVELYIRVLLAAVKLAKEKYRVPTLIPYMKVPDTKMPKDYLPRTGLSDDAIVARLRRGGAVVIDVSLEKEEADGAKISIQGDGHATPLANRMRARTLKTYIEQNMPVVLLSNIE